jgi:RNA polymerase sigma factor (sigma-70 family)
VSKDDPRDDFALLAGWRAGDRSAGSVLFARHFSSIYRFVRSKVDEGADDLTQKIFLALVERPEAFADVASFRGYLFGVARNQLLMWLRSNARHGGRIDPASWSIVDIRGSATRMHAAVEQHRILVEALQRLPVDQQVAIEMHYLEGLGTAEIAHVLEVPTGTVKARLSRAREALRVVIGQLAEPADLLNSTLGQLDDWIRGLPAGVRHTAGDGPS